jgi:hypothetical protein
MLFAAYMALKRVYCGRFSAVGLEGGLEGVVLIDRRLEGSCID